MPSISSAATNSAAGSTPDPAASLLVPMKPSQLIGGSIIVFETCMLIGVCLMLRDRPSAPPSAAWTVVRHEAGGFAIACPADAQVELDGRRIRCLGPYGRHATAFVGTTSLPTAKAFIAQANVRGFVGAEMTVIETRMIGD